MAFLDRITKGVTKAAEQAKFEADKLVRVNKLNSELNALTRDLENAKAGIGAKVIELCAAGQIALPEIDDLIAQVKTLEAQIAAKKAELEAARSAKFGETTFEPEATPSTPVTSEEAAPKFCPGCGAKLETGAKFCPSCGQKLE